MFYLRFFFLNFEKMSESLVSFFLVSDVSESLISLKSNELCERIAQVAACWCTDKTSQDKTSQDVRYYYFGQIRQGHSFLLAILDQVMGRSCTVCQVIKSIYTQGLFLLQEGQARSFLYPSHIRLGNGPQMYFMLG